jgi:2-methylcitrate dehydratase PrpD
MTGDVTPRFVQHVVQTRYEDIQEEAIWRAKVAVLDIIAVAIGASASHITAKTRKAISASRGNPESRVLVFGERLPAANAAFVNAVMSRVLDFDDTYELAPNGAHASAYIVPVAMALADRDASITGKEFLTAITVASDLYCRLTRAIRANAVDTGRDNGPSVFGTYACAARLLKLNNEQALNGFGIAYAHCAGEFQMYEEASETVSLQQGVRARTGIEAAELARAGLGGPHEVFFGRYGFYRAFEPVHDVDQLLDSLGTDFVSRQLSYKPFPCCKCMHPAISAALALREKEAVNPDYIESVRIGTNRLCENFLAMPRETKWDPRTLVTAKFSLPYGVAVAAAKGRVGLSDFEDGNLDDPEVRRILKRTSVEIDPDIERTDGQRQNAPAVVYFRLRSGAEISHRVDHPLGHPFNLPNFSQVEMKLRQCAEHSAIPFTERQLAVICSEVQHLPDAPSAARLLDLITPSGN